MATLSAVPFSALPVTDDGYTLLNENGRVHRSSKKLSELVGARTSSFLDKEQYANDSATFLTAHQNLDEYATMEWVEDQNYISGVDLTNYYTKSETSGKEEIANALTAKQNLIQSKKNSSLPYLETSNSEPSWEVIESEQINAHGTAQEGEVYNTTINGRAYTMVCLNGKLWLAENYVDSTKASYTDSKYGSYFTEATIKLANFVPEGWHLPSKEEYQGLIDYTENHEKYLATTDWHTLDYQGNPDPNYIEGTNELKLNILPGGEYYNSTLNSSGYLVRFWTNTDETLSQSTGKQRVYVKISNYIGYDSKIISFDWSGPGSQNCYNVRLIKDDLDVSGPDCWKTFKGKNFMAISDNEGNTFKDFYLKKVEAQATYQPIGNYASSAGVETLNTYYALTTTGWKDIAEDFYDKITINNSLSLKQDNLSFAGENNTITSINNSAVGGGGTGGDYVPLSATDCRIGSKNKNLDDNNIFAQGTENSAGAYSVSQGKYNYSNFHSLAQGMNNSANSNSLAQGMNNSANGNSLAQGTLCYAINESIAQGENNSAMNYSFAQGKNNSAYNYGFAAGTGNSANTTAAALGQNCSSYYWSIANGDKCSATDRSLAQGERTYADLYSLSQGFSTSATTYSLSQGNTCYATQYSFAQGYFCSSYGFESFAQGSNCVATGSYSFAQGYYTTAKSYSQAMGNNLLIQSTAMAIGEYNKTTNSANESAAFVIGNGNNKNRSDAFVVYKNGKVSGGDFVAGGVSLSSLTPVTLTFRTVGE